MWRVVALSSERRLQVVAGLIAAVAATCAAGASDFEVRVLSSRTDSISGGDVLVQLSAPISEEWSAHLNGRDVTRSFKPAQGSAGLVARLTGLEDGRNTLELRVGHRIRAKRRAVASICMTDPVTLVSITLARATEFSSKALEKWRVSARREARLHAGPRPTITAVLPSERVGRHPLIGTSQVIDRASRSCEGFQATLFSGCGNEAQRLEFTLTERAEDGVFTSVLRLRNV